jgi:uncharacterized protein (DUF305 family)
MRHCYIACRRGRAAQIAAKVFSIVGLMLTVSSLSASPDETSFLKENNVAMTKMMTAMEVKPSGDVDTDFVAMMVPHHQGAIDMAQAELRYGRNEQLRRMAQEIIVTQQQEIAVMRMALGQPPSPSVPSPDQPSQIGPTETHPMSHHSMHMRPEP